MNHRRRSISREGGCRIMLETLWRAVNPIVSRRLRLDDKSGELPPLKNLNGSG